MQVTQLAVQRLAVEVTFFDARRRAGVLHDTVRTGAKRCEGAPNRVVIVDLLKRTARLERDGISGIVLARLKAGASLTLPPMRA